MSSIQNLLTWSVMIRWYKLSRASCLKSDRSSSKEYGVLLNSQKNIPHSLNLNTCLTLEDIQMYRRDESMMIKYGNKFRILYYSSRSLIPLPEVKILQRNSFLSISRISVLPPVKIYSFSRFCRTFGKCTPKSISMKCMLVPGSSLIPLPKAIWWITIDMQLRAELFHQMLPSEHQTNLPATSQSIANCEL